MKRLFTALCLLALCGMVRAQRTVDLSGEWQFEIDRQDVGQREQWADRELSDRIKLPASMPERLKGDDISVDTKWVGSLYDSSYFFNPYLERYRQPGQMKLTFFLTPDKHYVGVAWYRKQVELTGLDKEAKRYILSLERPHIQTTLYVNGREAGSDRSLCVAHEYDVTELLEPGMNTFAIRIDNRLETVNVGQDSHSVTDQTQGDWNGIVGKMELREVPSLRITDLQVFPDVDRKVARVRLTVAGQGKKKAKLALLAKSFNSNVTTVNASFVDLPPYSDKKPYVDYELILGDKMQLWDEFNPNLYRLQALVVESHSKTEKYLNKNRSSFASPAFSEYLKENGAQETVFGMRKFEIRDRMFYVNGRQIQLRGTVENCDFPLTGYAPMDLESWLRVFNICKSYGLNHMRFHSYCPPEAAFMAADLTGFYIQPEGPSWPNHGVKLGYGDDIDTYLMEETQRLTKAYGNHPSFCMLACGNEPAGRWVEWVGKFVDYWKSTDPRRVYTGASVGGGWAWQPKSQYHVKAGARGLAEWARRAPDSMDDFRQQISHYKAKDMETDIHEPYVSHETGQWCAFPDFSEIDQYTGVNKAKNFEVFRDILSDHGMGAMDRKFLMASGKLQALCYKYEIERTLRTPDYAGFQLLSLNDYSGQGTALVGVTNVFFRDKGYMDCDEFSSFCSPIVPLARIPKFTWKNTETFHADIELNQFSDHELANTPLRYMLERYVREPKMEGAAGGEKATSAVLQTEFTGELPAKTYPIGSSQKAGVIDIPLSKFNEPTHLRLRVEVPGTSSCNSWDFWVYPESTSPSEEGIYICDSLNSEALATLEAGGKVLITAGKNVKFGSEVVQQFTPVFWNTSWFKMRPPHTTGLYVDNTHSIFTDFPTAYHSDLQWWELVNKAPVMQFDEFPADFQPLVQSIDTWFLSRKIGMLFEANVLNGKLVMTTMDISSNLDKRIVARQMRDSILSYMQSDRFNPEFAILPETISNLFTKSAPKIDMFTKDSPDELKPKLK